jgi:hypothetical protein
LVQTAAMVSSSLCKNHQESKCPKNETKHANSIIKPPATRIWYAISTNQTQQSKSMKNAYAH